MFEKTAQRRSKTKSQVSLSLTDGRTVEGALFMLPGERISDALNDDRSFLPIETMPGRTTMVAKTSVATVILVEEAQPLSDDPYAILRVNPSASAAEIRAAWMKRLKACHPDRLAALDLDPEIITAAREASQRINAAYDDLTVKASPEKVTEPA